MAFCLAATALNSSFHVVPCPSPASSGTFSGGMRFGIWDPGYRMGSRMLCPYALCRYLVWLSGGKSG